MRSEPPSTVSYVIRGLMNSVDTANARNSICAKRNTYLHRCTAMELRNQMRNDWRRSTHIQHELNQSTLAVALARQVI